MYVYVSKPNISRGGALTVLTRLTLEKQKITNLLSYFRGSVVLLASKLRLTLAASLTTLTKPGWLELANDAFYLIGSAVFQRMAYH
jgi:hypothetical protein